MRKLKILCVNRKMNPGEHIVELFREYGYRYDLIRFPQIEEDSLIQMISFDYDVSKEICKLLNIFFDPDGDNLPEFFDFDYSNENDEFYEILGRNFEVMEVELSSLEKAA